MMTHSANLMVWHSDQTMMAEEYMNADETVPLNHYLIDTKN